MFRVLRHFLVAPWSSTTPALLPSAFRASRPSSMSTAPPSYKSRPQSPEPSLEPSAETTNTFSVNGFIVTTTSSNILSEISITHDPEAQLNTNNINNIIPSSMVRTTDEHPRKLRKTAPRQPGARLARCKRFLGRRREYFAEFLGTLVLFLFGLAGSLSALPSALPLDKNDDGIPDYIGVFSWSIGVFCAILIASNASEAHLNPAVTIMKTCFRGFPWKKALGYIGAQFCGAMAGTGIAYGLQHDTIQAYVTAKDSGNWSYDTLGTLLYTMPAKGVGIPTAIFNEAIASALLAIIILSQDNKTVCGVRSYLGMGFMALSVAGLSVGFGHNTGGAMNPFRDLAPRLVARACLWSGTEPFTAYWVYWTWGPIGADLAGMLLGALAFELLVSWPKAWAVLPEGDLEAGGGADGGVAGVVAAAGDGGPGGAAPAGGLLREVDMDFGSDDRGRERGRARWREV